MTAAATRSTTASCTNYYDHLNRLSEVYVCTESASWSSSGPESMSASSSIGLDPLDDPDEIHAGRAKILEQAGGLEGILKGYGDPEFRSRLSAPVGIVREEQNEDEDSAEEPVAFGSTLQLVAVYIYDGFNRRVARLASGVIGFSAYDGWREAEELVAEFDGESFVPVPIKQFVWGERLDEQVAYKERANGGAAWSEFFVNNGGQDSVTRILDTDGGVVEAREYDPYGVETKFLLGGSTANPYSWKGHRLDPETGLIYMRNRYYSPAIGRFMTLDSLGVWGDVANLGNAYCYAANAPQVRWDPFGMFSSASHESITREALANLGLSKECIDLVVAANVGQDKGAGLNRPPFSDPVNHGDNNRITETINELHGRLENSSDKTADQLLQDFGKSSHALQDLYSHSTYVEHNGGSANLMAGYATTGSIPLWNMGPGIGMSGPPHVPPSVISGEYKWPLDNAPSPSHREINKDSPGSFRGAQLNHTGTTNFDLARDLATRHTRDLWNQFINSLPEDTRAQLRGHCTIK